MRNDTIFQQVTPRLTGLPFFLFLIPLLASSRPLQAQAAATLEPLRLSVAIHFTEDFKNFQITEDGVRTSLGYELQSRGLSLVKAVFGADKVWEIKKTDAMNSAAILLVPKVRAQSRPSPDGKKKTDTEISIEWQFYGGAPDAPLASITTTGTATGKSKDRAGRHKTAADQLFLNSRAALATLKDAPAWAARQKIFDAIKADDRAALATLLAAGNSADFTSRQGDTPLLIACYLGKPAAATFLLEQGADPNAANKKGVTPLMLATSNNNKALVTALLDAGANAAAQLPDGTSCQSIAQLKGLSEISTLITERTGIRPPAVETLPEIEVMQKIAPFLALFPPESWLPASKTRTEMVMSNRQMEADNPRPAPAPRPAPPPRRYGSRTPYPTYTPVSPSISSGVSLMESRESKTSAGEKYSGYWEKGALVSVEYYRWAASVFI